jgi:hypothetical protein
MARGGFNRMGTDTVPAMLSPGEMVLNAQQQANLFRMAKYGEAGGGGGDIYIDMRGAVISSEQQFEQMVSRALSRAGGKARPILIRGRQV